MLKGYRGITVFFKRSGYLPNKQDIGFRTACMEQDSLAVADYLQAPMVGTTDDLYVISYFAQVRSIGRIGSHASPEEIGSTVQDYGIATILVFGDPDLADVLQRELHYQVVRNTAYCGRPFTIIRTGVSTTN